ncbi:MAG TPA: Rrf2 family transcriptional regulator [Rhodocyclaceae bacterium]|jgi:Rrf2 family nitric oxide-sensitive transcriptional repressor|nr:Rrf2 family transcriptional regulator [Rhodocyclaceae bacterium]
MQLTRFTDFGLRMLMYLSKQDRATPITIAEIAEQFQIPHNHLIKVANRLGKLGLINAMRGRNGGLTLAIPAEQIRLGQALRGLEGDTPLVNCEEPPCVLAGRCLLVGALRAGQMAFYDRMDQYTLADVSTGRTEAVIIKMHRTRLAGNAAAF